MAVARVACRAQVGLEAPLVQVEVSLGSGASAAKLSAGSSAASAAISRASCLRVLATVGMSLSRGLRNEYRLHAPYAARKLVKRAEKVQIPCHGVSAGDSVTCVGQPKLAHHLGANSINPAPNRGGRTRGRSYGYLSHR